MLRNFILLSLIISCFFYSHICAGDYTNYKYRPLSGKEKSLFKKTYKDLKKVYESSDFVTFKKFAPITITEFENIQLDPSCKSLKQMYSEIDSLLHDIERKDHIDLERQKIARMGSETRIGMFDELVTLYTNASVLDSVTMYQRKLYQSADSVFVNDPSIDNYKLINAAHNLSLKYKQSARKKVESLFQDKFLELSSTMDLKAINEFQSRYPEMYTEDIVSLKEKIRQLEKLSILRNPSFQRWDEYKEKFGDDEKLSIAVKAYYRRKLIRRVDTDIFEEYYKRFPEDDFKLFSVIEGQLFSTFIGKKTVENADLYLKYFPKGRYANIIMEQLAVTEGLSQNQVK